MRFNEIFLLNAGRAERKERKEWKKKEGILSKQESENRQNERFAQANRGCFESCSPSGASVKASNYSADRDGVLSGRETSTG
jgi:hypothetical protein